MRLGRAQATEVYAVLRPLRELGGPLVHSLPQCTKDLLKDVGICHYMTVRGNIPLPEARFDTHDPLLSTLTSPPPHPAHL